MAGALGYIWNNGSSTINISASSQTNAVYQLKELLKTAGWIIQASSDGTNVSNTPGNANDQITTSAKMGNSNSWFTIAQPAITNGIGYPGHSQILIKHYSSQANWLIALIPPNTDGSIQGSSGNGTSTVPPTYATAVEHIGTLPNTNGVWANTLTYSFTIGAMNIAPYNFHMYSWNTSGDPISAGGSIIFDNIIPGSGAPGDNYPVVMYCGTNAENPFIPGSAITTIQPQYSTNNTQGGRTYVGFGTSYVSSCPVALAREVIDATAANIVCIPCGIGLDPYGAQFREPFLPARWYAGGWGGNYGASATVLGTAGSKGWPYTLKGVSSSLHWQAAMWCPGSMQSKQYTKDVVAMGALWFPHDGSTQLVIL